jgi:hypothetical protein
MWNWMAAFAADICACQTISQFGGVVCRGNVGHDLPIKHLLLSGLLLDGLKFSYTSNTSIVTKNLVGTDDLPPR